MNPQRPIARKGLSVIEMLIALTISSTLLTATLGALDASFKSYKSTTETVSTHVVGRLVMHRLSSLIRNGEEFGPFPVNPILTPEIESTSLEFVAYPDADPAISQIWRLSRVAVPGANGPFELRATVEHYQSSTLVSTSERTLMRRVQDLRFVLEYDVGPRLRRATIDFTILADDDQADTIGSALETPAVRMVSSVSPRRLD